MGLEPPDQQTIVLTSTCCEQSDFKERQARLDGLKRKKAENVKEKEQIMQALAEDKMERERRAEQKKIVQDAEASTAGLLHSHPALRTHCLCQGVVALDCLYLDPLTHYLTPPYDYHRH